MEDSTPLVTFYDIAFGPPMAETTCAPNPWKARYALNAKAVPYKTTWVPMLDISKVRLAMGVPAARKFADGSDYHTLPMITDSSTDSIVGDSFDIAIHMQTHYADSGVKDLFPPQKLDYVFEHDLAIFAPLSGRDEGVCGDYVRFNHNVDAAFSAHVMLMAHGLPFDSVSGDDVRAEFARRAGVPTWDDLAVRGEKRGVLWGEFRETLAGLARLFMRDCRGPFLLGEEVNFGDFIVGGWLKFMKGTLTSDEWEEARTWHDGVFGRLFDALEKYAEVH